MRYRFLHLALALVAVTAIVSLSACSTSGTGGGNTLTGVISEVSGDLTNVSGFVVLAEDGSSHRFTPTEGLLFEGGPLTHLREHVVTGQRVVVTFERGVAGELIATSVEDV
jgi:hypothetical protein